MAEAIHPPRSLDGLEREQWDYVITVCDRAKESCRDAFLDLSRRVDLLLALPALALRSPIVK